MAYKLGFIFNYHQSWVYSTQQETAKDNVEPRKEGIQNRNKDGGEVPEEQAANQMRTRILTEIEGEEKGWENNQEKGIVLWKQLNVWLLSL